MPKSATLPSSQSLLDDFSERHLLELTDLVRREQIAIRATSIANIIIKQDYSKLDNNELSDSAIGLLLQMLDRNFEHAEASIVAFVTGCGSSAEVITRASVESSVNIIYILSGERADRLKSYFEHYFSQVDSQTDKWETESMKLQPHETALQKVGIEKRRAANETVRTLMRSILGEAKGTRWPKSVLQRFSEIEDALSYRTIYARMSSETHSDAEETVRYFLGKVHNDPTILEKMALETIEMTRFYIYYAVSMFLNACLAYAKIYSLETSSAYIQKEIDKVQSELSDISLRIGA